MDGYRVKSQKRKYIDLYLVVVIFVLWAPLSGGTVSAYQEEEVAGGASITGVMKFAGSVPTPKTYKVTMGSHPEFCQTIADKKGYITVPKVRVSSKLHLADVVVFLQEVDRGKPLPKEEPILAVDRCQFVPRVIGTLADQNLRMVMRDPILHQIRGWEMLENGRLPLFHISNLGKDGEATLPLKARRSSIIKWTCDQHSFMEGWLLLAANPYVTVSDDQGVFRLTDIPAGTHTVGAWHPVLGYQEAKITLISGRQETLELTFDSPSNP
ncbi:carboxypeptidase-like regulatory domain-containing protein [Candidatus Nitrospira neomarina]|uniref:Carboxypeptidase-like regulatory domain-containing protein n=1 Tax=Candidatus Nitrospira neomarina TaxID=3020899 RepID=A0AA96GJW3_9BACT|nr:carboxypeptidase-like regulatory domain-containing protein [Candidatus Nitrospira neomarina]WNM63291.1 carboxypeptidase-like regulatory domain-containing protein [Candidatus Nitrospira neomarina]